MNFEDIYREYGPKVYRLCLGYTNDADWAKDLVQDTFIQVWKNLNRFRGDSSIGTWIFRIAVNICLRQVNRNNKIKSVQLSENIGLENPEDNREEIENLRTCIAGLEHTDRLIITMVLEDIPYSEIAGILGISEGNLRVKIHRVKKILLKKFNEYEKV